MRELNTLLAIVRNALGNRLFRDSERLSLSQVHEDVESSGTPFRELIQDCISRAVTNAECGEFDHAMNEINLIHNVPLSGEAVKNWDELYFYQFELCGFLEGVQSVERARACLALCSKAIDRIHAR